MHMNKFKITCPECGAELITAWPQTVIWELCPSCHHHVWDGYDAMMADVERSAGPAALVGDKHDARSCN